MPDRTTGPTLVAIDQTELVLTGAPTGPTDLLFDGQRVLSFGPRDLKRSTGGLHYRWPVQLRPYLRGHTVLTLREHLTEEILLEEPVGFDESTDRTRLVDEQDRPLAVDKSGKVGPMFESAQGETLSALLDTAQRVIVDITDFGAVAFVGYGTLLGAVRNGKVIGHDNDVDLICFSNHSEPTALLRESLLLARFLRDRGWTVDQPRASFIRVAIGQGYLDIFSAFHDGERLYVDRFVWADVPVNGIVPAGTITLEGRDIAAPRDPGQLLASIYGPDYLVPDPALRHHPRRELVRTTRAWFGNYRFRRKEWREWATVIHPEQPEVSALARTVAERAPAGGAIVDLGCGHGQDAIWLAHRGFRVVGADHVFEGVNRISGVAQAEQLPLEASVFSFENASESLAHGTLVAATTDPESLTLIANDLLDVLAPEGRENFWQFVRIALLTGGRLMLSIRDDPRATDPDQPRLPHPISTDDLLAEGTRHGARVIDRDDEGGRTTLTLVFDR